MFWMRLIIQMHGSRPNLMYSNGQEKSTQLAKVYVGCVLKMSVYEQINPLRLSGNYMNHPL
jgi:hypothetical protein